MSCPYTQAVPVFHDLFSGTIRFYNSRITCDSPREKISLICYVFLDSLVEFIYLGESFQREFS